MLYLYLESLTSQKEEDKVSESVDSMKNLVERMEKMIQQIGEKVLEHDKETLETIKQEQEKSVVDFCIEKIGQKIITSCGDNGKETWSELSKFLIEDYLLLPTLWDYRSSTYNKDAAKKLLELRRTVNGKFEQILGKYNMDLYAFDFDSIEEMSTNVVEFAKKAEINSNM